MRNVIKIVIQSVPSTNIKSQPISDSENQKQIIFSQKPVIDWFLIYFLELFAICNYFVYL